MPKNFWLKSEANKRHVKTGENLLQFIKLIPKERCGKVFDLINLAQKGNQWIVCECSNKLSKSTNNAAILTEKLLAARESQE